MEICNCHTITLTCYTCLTCPWKIPKFAILLKKKIPKFGVCLLHFFPINYHDLGIFFSKFFMTYRTFSLKPAMDNGNFNSHVFCTNPWQFFMCFFWQNCCYITANLSNVSFAKKIIVCSV